MKVITNIFRSSLGKKYIMAVSGLMMFLFVIGHLVGNLQFFLGAESINRYGHFLQTNLELIWPARIALLLRPLRAPDTGNKRGWAHAGSMSSSVPAGRKWPQPDQDIAGSPRSSAAARRTAAMIG